jgi:hypothetical protein
VIVEKVEEPKKVNAGRELARHLRDLGRKLNRSKYTSEEVMEMTRGPFNDLDAD